MKQQVSRRRPENIEDLRMYIEEEIECVSRKECQNLVVTMKERVRKVIEEEGNVIPY